MATAMVVTSLYAPQNVGAAAKNAVVLKGSTKTVKSKSIYLAGKTVDFDAIIKGKKVKDSAGKWTTSSKKVATVDKNGVVKVVGAGTAIIKFTDKKSKKAVSVKIYGRVRASKVMVSPAAVTVKEGESVDVNATYEFSENVKAAGADATTYKLFAESSDENVATVSVDGNDKIMVKGVAKSATPATIKVYAAQVDTLAKAKEVKIKATTEFTVKVTGSFAAEQNSANTVKVTGTDLTDKAADYAVKSDKGTVLAVKAVKINEDKSATLELDTYQIPDGKYTVTFNKQDAEFVAQKAVVKEIKFTQEDKAIGIYNKAKTQVEKATVVFQVFDQFGNDITNTNIPRLNIFGSHSAKTEGKGRIIFTETANGGFQINLSKVSVNVVDLNSGVSKSGMFTVSDIARVSEAKFMGIYNKVSKKFVKDVKEDSNIENNVLLYEVKDQFGNPIEDAKATNELFVNLLTFTRIKAEADKEYTVDIDGKKYIAYILKRTSVDKKTTGYGKVDVQALLVSNGKTLKDTFEVTHKVQVDTITFREGAKGVNVGEKSGLEYTAYDIDGKLITDYETLKEGLIEMDKTAPKLILEEDKATGKGIFKFDATTGFDNLTSDALTIPATINVKTRTGKFSVNTINVRNKRRPVEFLGIKEEVVKGITKGNKFELKYGDLVFKDQFGNKMTAGDIAALYGNGDFGLSVKVSGSTGKFTAGELKINGVVTADGTAKEDIALTGANLNNLLLGLTAEGATTGFANVEFVFNTKGANNKYSETDNGNKSISKFTTQVYSVLLNDMKHFEVKEVKKQAANDLYVYGSYMTYQGTAPEYFLEPEVFGYYEGLKIKLSKTTDYALSGGVKKNGDANGDLVNVPSKYTITSGMDAESYFQIGIENADRTVITTKYTYSKELPKIAKIDNNGSVVKVASGADKTVAWDSGDGKIRSAIDITDQYGNVVKVAPIVYLEEVRKDGAVVNENIAAKTGTNGKTNFELEVKNGLVDGVYDLDLKIVVPNTNLVLRTTIKVKKGN